MASVATLYTPVVLALAVELAAYPFDSELVWQGEARSLACGSTIALGFELDDEKKIARIGLRIHACAIGQAAAALFAADAAGKSLANIESEFATISAWLNGGPLPGLPRFGTISAASAYPARHGAILLPWKAAVAALPSACKHR